MTDVLRVSEPALFTRLRGARRVLIAGAGGGFDVYAGLPLALTLQWQGKEVALANVSFADLGALPAEAWLTPGVAAVGPDSPGDPGYFPERTLARWLASHAWWPSAVVYAFPRTGVIPLRAAYRALVARLEIDALVLVDAGTDILMRGDEAGLGTPEEDIASLVAVAGLDQVAVRLVTCVGFGIDSHHGVSGSHVLENIAALDRAGAYLGAFSLPARAPETALYLDAVADAEAATPTRPSIVHGQITAALRGEFGDIHASDRTRGSTLFVNPLMTLCFAFDLPGLADQVVYRDLLETTHTRQDVKEAIEKFRHSVRLRAWRTIPH